MFKNTTAVPNQIFDVLLKDLSMAELKVLLVIVRQTIGWTESKTKKERKTSDWISISQFADKTGASRRSVNSAIHQLSEKSLIDITDENDVLLDTPEKRKGKAKLIFRLSSAFFASVHNKGKSCLQAPFFDTASAKNASDLRKNVSAVAQKLRITKETPTKETLTKFNY